MSRQLVVCTIVGLTWIYSVGGAAAASNDRGESSDSTPAQEDPARSESEDEKLERQLDSLQREVDRKTGDEEPSETPDASADDESVDQQLDDLESEVETSTTSGSGNGSTRSQSEMNPELSVIFDGGFAWHKHEPTLVGGPDPNSYGPFLQSVELAFQADVDPFFTFESHLVAGLSGLKVGEAYGTTLALPAKFQARLGKFKTRFGRVNPLHLHAWHFTALPLVNGKFFGPAGLNGLGAEISQILPTPWYAEWVVAVQDLSSPATGHAFLRNPERLEDPLDLVASARLAQFFSLGRDWDLLWGLNAAAGRNDSGRPGSNRNHSTIYGTDLFIKHKPVERGGRSEVGWQTEVLLRRRETPVETLTDIGGYSYLYWAPVRNWEFGGRYEYVSGPLDADRDYLHPNWLAARQRAGVAASFYPSNFSRFRLEYMAGAFDRGLSRLEHTILLQTQLVTGAHGAHKF